MRKKQSNCKTIHLNFIFFLVLSFPAWEISSISVATLISTRLCTGQSKKMVIPYLGCAAFEFKMPFASAGTAFRFSVLSVTHERPDPVPVRTPLPALLTWAESAGRMDHSWAGVPKEDVWILRCVPHPRLSNPADYLFLNNPATETTKLKAVSEKPGAWPLDRFSPAWSFVSSHRHLWALIEMMRFGGG